MSTTSSTLPIGIRRKTHGEFPCEIFFEDQHLIVFSKPAGLLSQPDSSGDPSLVDLLRVHFGRPYVGGVHRLDRNTSGLMVFAKRTKAADRLTEALKSGQLVRRYQALLNGVLEGDFLWTDWLLKDESTNTVRVVKKDLPGAKRASLKGRVLESRDGISLVEFELETGRSHQIRVQSASRGYPLVGDLKYGKSVRGNESPNNRLALHSSYLKFPHPMDKENILEFESPLPNDLIKLWPKGGTQKTRQGEVLR